MEMHMVVAIDVIEGKTGVLEGLKLGPDFLFQLPSDPGTEEKIHPGPEEMRGKLPSGTHQTGHPVRGRCWGSVDQYKMQSDPQ